MGRQDKQCVNIPRCRKTNIHSANYEGSCHCSSFSSQYTRWRMVPLRAAEPFCDFFSAVPLLRIFVPLRVTVSTHAAEMQRTVTQIQCRGNDQLPCLHPERWRDLLLPLIQCAIDQPSFHARRNRIIAADRSGYVNEGTVRLREVERSFLYHVYISAG